MNTQSYSQDYLQLKKEGDSLYKAGDYNNAAVLFSAAARLVGDRADIWVFNRAAFSWSLSGKPDSAFKYLDAISNIASISFIDYLDVVDDDDFKLLKNDPRWFSLNLKLFRNANLTFFSNLPILGGRDKLTQQLNAADAWAFNNNSDSAFFYLNEIANSKFLTSLDVDKVLRDGYLDALHNDNTWKGIITKMSETSFLILYKTILSKLNIEGVELNVSGEEQINFAKALTRNPDSAFIHLNDWATVFLKQKKYRDALKIIEISDQIFPNNYWIQLDFSNYYATMKDTSKAFVYSSKALNLKYFVPSIQSLSTNRDSALTADYHMLFKKFSKSASRKQVLFDEGHYNFHTPWGSYAALANLFRENGFDVSGNKEKFSRQVLQKTDVLLVASAASDNLDSLYKKEQTANEPLRFSAISTKSAFTDLEVLAIKEWVKSGGSLFLVIDHAPHPKTAESLAALFGIETHNVTTFDSLKKDITVKTPTLLFTKKHNLLGTHPILKGVDSITTYTGSSLKGPTNSQPLLILPSTTIDMDIDLSTKKQRFYSGAGRVQGLAMKFGKGRVVVVAEAGMFTSKPGTGLYSLGSEGIARKDRGNRQFALNIVKWLAGLKL